MTLPVRPRICLFGASPSTANLGVCALHHATVAALLARLEGAQITVFDHGHGLRSVPFETRGKRYTVQRLGAHHSRRYWRGDSLATMRVAARLGGLGNVGAQAIRRADAVLDLSGGDSFTDLYGPKRFWGVTLPKEIALDCGTPLVLPPQTYGPFRDEELRAVAARVVAGAAQAWARDPRSLENLAELLGDRWDGSRHRLGVDVAFLLERRRPARPLSERVEAWLASGNGPVIGVNVSGLVYLDPERGRRDYGFQADYRAVIAGLLDALIHETDARIVLVPHVLEPPGHYESDPEACAAVAASLPAERIALLEGDYSVTEVKDLIARLEWFCGTRMHATIAALSSGVPAAAIAYSPKFRGIFETCDQAQGIVDPTRLETRAAVEELMGAFHQRAELRERLGEALPPVLALAEEQADELARACRTDHVEAASA